MELLLQRYSDNGNSTLGLLYIDGKFFGYSLEDEYRNHKVPGETRIPAGTYKVDFNEFIHSPMAEKYKKRFSWFNAHLEIKDVPNFTAIYIHIGNDEDDTRGCVLVADNANNNMIKKGFIAGSTSCYKRLYQKISKQLDMNKPVEIIIRDECAVV